MMGVAGVRFEIMFCECLIGVGGDATQAGTVIFSRCKEEVDAWGIIHVLGVIMESGAKLSRDGGSRVLGGFFPRSGVEFEDSVWSR